MGKRSTKAPATSVAGKNGESLSKGQERTPEESRVVEKPGKSPDSPRRPSRGTRDGTLAAQMTDCGRCSFHGHPCVEHRPEIIDQLVEEERRDYAVLRREASRCAKVLRSLGQDAAADRLLKAAGVEK